jgi:hypothetical protein
VDESAASVIAGEIVGKAASARFGSQNEYRSSATHTIANKPIHAKRFRPFRIMDVVLFMSFLILSERIHFAIMPDIPFHCNKIGSKGLPDSWLEYRVASLIAIKFGYSPQ